MSSLDQAALWLHYNLSRHFEYVLRQTFIYRFLTWFFQPTAYQNGTNLQYLCNQSPVDNRAPHVSNLLLCLLVIAALPDQHISLQRHSLLICTVNNFLETLLHHCSACVGIVLSFNLDYVDFLLQQFILHPSEQSRMQGLKFQFVLFLPNYMSKKI